MIEYELGEVVFGSREAIHAAFADFLRQPVDEERLAADRRDPFGGVRRTLTKEVRVEDVGTFDGRRRQSLIFAPSERPGWWIRRTDLSAQLDTLVHVQNLWTSAHNLVLRSGAPSNYLRMVEHIVALKAGLGIDNVLVKVGSGDPPLFDRSSLPLVEAMDEARAVATDAPASYVTVKRPVVFGGKGGQFLAFMPAAEGERNLRIDCAIRWNSCIGEERVRFDVTEETFRHAAIARTNCTRNQYWAALTVGKLFAATRHWGYTRENILIHGKHGYHNPPRLKVGEKFLEPVWHRATLDLMAALSLTGADRFCGTVLSYRAGHTLDCDAVRALYRHDLLKELA